MEKKLFKTLMKSVRQADEIIRAGRTVSSKGSAHESILLSLQDQQKFAEALLTPPKPPPALKRAFARRRKLIQPQ